VAPRMEGPPFEDVREAVEKDRKDNGRDPEEAWEPPTEGRTWRRRNPAPKESPHETKNPAAQRYHPEKTPLMLWHAGPKTERVHPERDGRHREGEDGKNEGLHDAEKEDEAPHREPIGGPPRDVSKDHCRQDPEGDGGEGHLERLAWGQ
jgi:hypothetical protein